MSLCNEVTASKEEEINPECEVWFEWAIKWLMRNYKRVSN
jgi:hypothetical protein